MEKWSPVKRLMGQFELAWPDSDPQTMQELRDNFRPFLEAAMAQVGGTVPYVFVIGSLQDPPPPYNPPDGF